jgi:hypothetical protein
MPDKITRKQRRRSSGIGAFEVLLSIGLVTIILAIGLDMSILDSAFSINDVACRDAASRAARENNQALAVRAAKSALLKHHTDGYFITQPALTSDNQPDFSFNDNNGAGWTLDAFPAPSMPAVSVTTFVNARLPVPLFFWGNNIKGILGSEGGRFKIVRRYTFPIMNLHVKGVRT